MGGETGYTGSMSGDQLRLPLRSRGITLDELLSLQESSPWPDQAVPGEGQATFGGEVSPERYHLILKARTVSQVCAAFRGKR